MFQEKYSKFLFLLIPILFIPSMWLGVRNSHDISVHLSWYLSFKDAIDTGAFYPRWLSTQNNSLGAPTLFFYPPFTNFYFLLIDLLTFKALKVGNMMAVATMTLSLLSGFSFYVWIKNFVRETPAVLLSLFYALAPYHVIIDYYERFAIAEYAAYIWVPLIFAGAYHVIKETGRAWPVILALSIAGLFMTHVLTAMIIGPIVVAYALTLLVKDHHTALKDKFSKILTLSFLGLLGIGVASIYLIPSIMLMEYLNSEALRWMDIKDTAIFLVTLDPNATFQKFQYKLFIIPSFYVVLSLAIIARFCIPDLRRKISAFPHTIYFWPITVFALYLLMNGYCNFLFQPPSPLRDIQFLWRMSVAIEFVGVTAVAMALSRHTQSGTRHYKFSLLLLVILLAIPVHFTIGKYSDLPLRPNPVESLKGRTGPPEYFPVGMTHKSKSMVAEKGRTYGKMPFHASVIDGKAKVTASEMDGTDYKLRVEAQTEARLAIHQFYFPGWSAVDENGNEYTVEMEAKDKFASFVIPKGSHMLTVRRAKTPPEYAALIVSGISLLLLLGLFLRLKTPLLKKDS